MMNPVVWLCAMLLLAPESAPNRLPGDGSFGVGPGAWQVTWSRRHDQPVRWQAGALQVPPGAQLGLERPIKLRPATVYTLACLASGRDGRERLRLSCAGQSAEFALSAGPTTYQLTFKTPGEQADEPLEVQPGLAVIAPVGAPGLAVLDDVRLVDGPRALAAAPEPAVDITWSDQLGAPLWQSADAALTVRQSATEPAVGGTLTLIDVGAERCGEQAPRRSWPLDAPGPTYTVPLGDLPAGMYLAEARFASGAAPLVARRYLPVLRDLRGTAVAEAWSFDPTALDEAGTAAAVGLREVRRVVAWTELVDAQGEYRWREIDASLQPAFDAGIAVTLVLDVSPAALLPPRVATTRDGQPDTERFMAFCQAVARHFAGRGVTYEMDNEPWLTWGLGDYAEYLLRFGLALRLADASARAAGLGTGCEPKAGGRVAPYLFDALRRDNLPRLHRVVWHLPAALGTEPERIWSTSLDRLADSLGSALRAHKGTEPGLSVVATSTAAGPLEPLPSDIGPSPWQVAARTVRARLLTARASAQMCFAGGWRGQADPLAVAVNQWLTRFDGARFVDDITLPDGLRGVRLALPNGRGLAALWNVTDSRATPREAPALGSLPRLTLAVDDLMVDTLFGGHVPADRVALGFDPIFITAPDVDRLGQWLASAVIEDWQPTTASCRLAVRDRAPGLLLSLRNGGNRPGPMPLALRADSGPTPVVGHLNALLPPGDQTIWVPFAAWPERSAGTVRLLAETGSHITDLSRALWSWPEHVGFRALRADGNDDDWDNEPGRTASTEDRLAAVDGSQWDGPDDASLTVRGDWRDGRLWLLVDVTDDVVTGGDMLDIGLDLDPAAPPVDAVGTEADHRLRLRPLVDSRAIGALEFTRLEPDQPQAIDDPNLRLGFRAGATGWSAELAVPLTPEAARRLDTGRVLGLQVTVTDDDGGGRAPSRLVFLGPTEATGLLPQVWLANDRIDHAGAPDVATAPMTRRLTLDGGADALPLTPPGFGEADVRYVDADDWLRGQRVLRVTRRAESAPSAVATIPHTGRVAIWARARALSDDQPAPRVGLREGPTARWLRPDGAWSRLDATLAAPADIVIDGIGTVDLAEVAWP